MKLINHILTETKSKDFADLKNKLFKARKNGYGCYTSEIKCKGFKVYYTSNDNHFCTYGISFQGVGMVSTLSLDKQSITFEGRQRGCDNHFLNDKQLNIELTTK